MNQKVIHGSASNIIAAWKLFRFAIDNKKAVFNVFGIGPFFLLVLRIAGIRKLVYSIHGTIYWNNYRQKIARKTFWWLAINLKEYHFTSNSEFSRKVFLEKIEKKANIIVLYNPISLKRFNSTDRVTSQSTDIKRIIYAGRLDYGKGLLAWIKCAISIHKVYPEIKFEIYGDGQLRQMLEKEIIKQDIERYVVIKGYVKDISEVYRKADLLLFLSEFESFGNVVVESVLCGTPVLTSDIPSMREIFRNYPDFLLPAEANPEQFILDKLKDYPTMKKLCCKASKEFRIRFSSEVHIKSLEKIYSQLRLKN